MHPLAMKSRARLPRRAEPSRPTPAVRDAQQIQAKLQIGPVDDPAEREADRVADRMMRMPARPGCLRLRRHVSALQIRKCPQRPTATARGKWRGRHRRGRFRLDAQPRRRGAARCGEPRLFRAALRPRLCGRAHPRRTGSRRGGRRFQARAFTLGRDVVFAAGEHDAASEDGKRLLAHELMHVVQQSDGSPRLQRQPAPAPTAAPAPARLRSLLPAMPRSGKWSTRQSECSP